MELYHLEYILEIERQKNISKAAERLHVSQPTLSIYLSKLERSLGVALFERQHNLLVPTKEGEKYAEACRKILAIRDELYEELLDGGRRAVRIGILRTTVPVFGRILSGLKKDFDRMAFLPQILSSEQIYQKLTEQQLDMGFVTSYQEKAEETYPLADCLLVREYELMLAMSKKNPLFEQLKLRDGCLDEASYGILEQMPIILGDRHMIKKRLNQSIYPRLKIRPREYEGLADFEFLPLALAAENGFCILPYSRIETGEIVQIPFSFHPKISRLFIFQKGKRLSPPQRALIKEVRAAYKDYPYYYDISPGNGGSLGWEMQWVK